MTEEDIARAAIAVVYQARSQDLLDILSEKHFPVTLLDAMGGFLQEQVVTLVVGVPHQRLPYFFYQNQEAPAVEFPPADVAATCYPKCQMIEVQMGEASIFVLPVERLPEA
jgi:uncharacterized protein YaaQ